MLFAKLRGRTRPPCSDLDVLGVLVEGPVAQHGVEGIDASAG